MQITDINVEGALAEVPGQYGPVTLSELLMQKIWMRGDFLQEGVRTLSGKSLEVRRVGKWNRLDGPDFVGADLEFNGEARTGDVEIHFYQRDWFGHGHCENPAFNNVILHVLVFDPDPDERPALTARGHQPEVLVLTPYLRLDLESYAEQESWLEWRNGGWLEWAECLMQEPLLERMEQLYAHSRKRWEGKLKFAESAMARGGWSQACQLGFLDSLGSIRNRAAMLRVGERLAGNSDPVPSLEQLLAAGEPWRRSGIRPANRPELVVGKYLELIRRKPDWAEQIRGEAFFLERAQGSDPLNQSLRAALKLGLWRKRIEHSYLLGLFSTVRINALLIDVLLPLWGLRPELTEAAFAVWFQWFAGAMPDHLRVMAAKVLKSSDKPCQMCNGWQQGAWQHVLAFEFRRRDGEDPQLSASEGEIHLPSRG